MKTVASLSQTPGIRPPPAGSAAWASRTVYQQYIGWYSGDPTELLPPSRAERARLMVELVGGLEGILGRAEEALGAGNPQWALELASHALTANPDSLRAKVNPHNLHARVNPL